MAEPLLDTRRRDRSLQARVDHCFNLLAVSLVVHLLNGTILVVLLAGIMPAGSLRLWLLALVAVTFARWLLMRAYRRRDRSRDAADAWARRFSIGACAAGAVWGAAGVFLIHPTSFPHQVLIAFALGGMAAGAIPLLAYLRQAYLCFVLPAVVPIAVRMLVAGDEVHLTMGLLLLIFGAAMIASAERIGRVFRGLDELQLRLDLSREERLALERSLRIDDLTGVANRRAFDERLENEWRRARRDGSILSVIAADVDHFKRYNDHYGHPAGDRCLTDVARAMAAQLKRPADLAARIGGEEFACILPDTPLEGANHLAMTIRAAVAALEIPHAAYGERDHVTVSLGVACSNHWSVESAADLRRLADTALYEAKHRGRNRVVLARS
jgi:diguanylate cyclase (GGDEF)-like protein